MSSLLGSRFSSFFFWDVTQRSPIEEERCVISQKTAAKGRVETYDQGSRQVVQAHDASKSFSLHTIALTWEAKLWEDTRDCQGKRRVKYRIQHRLPPEEVGGAKL